MFDSQEARDQRGRWTKLVGLHEQLAGGLKGALRKRHEATIHAARTAVALSKGEDFVPHLDRLKLAVTALRIQIHHARSRGEDDSTQVAAYQHYLGLQQGLVAASRKKGEIPEVSHFGEVDSMPGEGVPSVPAAVPVVPEPEPVPVPVFDPVGYAHGFTGFKASRARPALHVTDPASFKQALVGLRDMVKMKSGDTDHSRVQSVVSSASRTQEALARYQQTRHVMTPLIRRDMKLLEKLLSDGRFRTIHEFPDLTYGTYGGAARKKIEEALGIASDDAERSPVYASLGFSSDHVPPPEHKLFAVNYGSCMVELHPQVMDRSTFTTRNTFRIPCHVNACLNAEEARLFHAAVGYQKPTDGYTEAQILGGVTLSDVRALRFHVSDSKNAQVARKLLDQQGLGHIPVHIQGHDGKLSLLGGI